jgi:hypothetical protein
MTLRASVVTGQDGRRSKDALVFIDPGAQRNFVVTSFARKAKLKPVRRERFTIIGFGEHAQTFMGNIYRIKFRPTSGSGPIKVEVSEVPDIVGSLLCIDPDRQDHCMYRETIPADAMIWGSRTCLLGLRITLISNRRWCKFCHRPSL